MIKNITFPKEYSFAGNPMYVRIEGDSHEEVIVGINIEGVKVIDLSVVLFGSGTSYKTPIEISSFFTPFFRKYEPHEGAIIDALDNFSLDYSITVTNFNKEKVGEFSGKAFRGGVDSLTFSTLSGRDSNIFYHRFLNRQYQFLFTTRTNSRNITLRETELRPFIFIHPGIPIKIITSNGKVLIPEVYPQYTVCTIDFNRIRRAIFMAYYEMPSYFAVVVDDKTIFHVTLIENQISNDIYLLRFKNSIGAYEQIEVTGKATSKTTYPEEDKWMSANEWGIYEEKRSRLSSREGLIVETGYKTKDELNHIKDLIKSEEIYLIDPDEKIYTLHPCLVTPEELNIPKVINEPQSLELNIRFIRDDKYDSPELLFQYPYDYSLQNITAAGRPEIDGDGLIYHDDFAFYAEIN